jgi:two-component system, OmpR family, sensor histidine kinase VicK
MVARADYNFIVKYGEITPDGVAVYDLNSRKFVYVNRFLTQIFGADDRELKENASNALTLVHPEDLPFAEHRYRELLSIGCIPPTEFRLKLAEDVIKHVSCEVLWLEESYTFALFIRDITDEKFHHEYLVKVSAYKDTLLDMLIHNLSGPLFLSRDAMRILQSSDTGAAADASKLIDIIGQSTSHCISIIDDFMQYEHTESVRTSVKKTRFDIVDKVEIATKVFREMNRNKKFVIKSGLEDRNISSDSVKFLQIVHNIISNAVKYTADDGTINISILQEANWFVVTISDNGTGIPPALRSHIFKEKVLGTPGLNGEKSNGVGLYLVHQLVQLLGGSITFTSEENAGSTFALRFPKE